jgi:hypothetical protein
MSDRILMPIQLAGSLAILALVPTNLGKLAAFAAWWLVTFRGLGRREAALYGFSIVFFTAMDAMAVRRGIFAFSDPDFLGIPAYEPICWGFLILHTVRQLGGEPVHTSLATGVMVATACAAPFAFLNDPDWLFVVGTAVPLAALALLRDVGDFRYVGYMMLVGVAWEAVGVAAGEWSYPGDPPGGVPLWFAPMWGAVGLASRRLVLPLVRSGPEDRLLEERA